jgi:hypothetical protein
LIPPQRRKENRIKKQAVGLRLLRLYGKFSADHLAETMIGSSWIDVKAGYDHRFCRFVE